MALRSPLALLLLLAAVAASALVAHGHSTFAPDCCISVSPVPFHLKFQKRLVSYRILGPQMGCQLEAIVFITQKGRELCVSPDADWAPGLMQRIDKRKRKAAGAKSQGI